MLFAIKSISKKKINKELHLFVDELEILKSLDHPNIIKFHETYQDKKYFHLVMEFCSGGELMEKILEDNSLSEIQTCKIMKKIFSAVNYLHEKGISHRDLKPENLMFCNKSNDAEIKIIDFGLSKVFRKKKDKIGEKDKNYDIDELKSFVGSPLYLAPEVIIGKYNYRCDNWSLGVILYILLSGYPPFLAESTFQIYNLIKKGIVKFNQSNWDNISVEAKDLIKKLICVDVEKRFTCPQALQHEWFSKYSEETEDNVLNLEKTSQVLTKLKNFHAHSRFKKEILKIIVNWIDEADLKELKDNFTKIDVFQQGCISKEELNTILKNFKGVLNEKEIDDLFKELGEDHKTCITYSDFLIRTIDFKSIMTEERMWKIFKYFDIDNSNTISIEDMKIKMNRFGRNISNSQLESMMKEFGKDQQRLSFGEFQNFIKKN